MLSVPKLISYGAMVMVVRGGKWWHFVMLRTLVWPWRSLRWPIVFREGHIMLFLRRRLRVRVVMMRSQLSWDCEGSQSSRGRVACLGEKNDEREISKYII